MLNVVVMVRSGLWKRSNEWNGGNCCDKVCYIIIATRVLSFQFCDVKRYFLSSFIEIYYLRKSDVILIFILKNVFLGLPIWFVYIYAYEMLKACMNKTVEYFEGVDR
uniref:Transmembrane protein n=1 Tax=Heterorhabditis bacteriophora TaxID=37862 RepID=A0A1I7WWU6_HETBA